MCPSVLFVPSHPAPLTFLLLWVGTLTEREGEHVGPTAKRVLPINVTVLQMTCFAHTFLPMCKWLELVAFVIDPFGVN